MAAAGDEHLVLTAFADGDTQKNVMMMMMMTTTPLPLSSTHCLQVFTGNCLDVLRVEECVDDDIPATLCL